jgi:hypothetical protein
VAILEESGLDQLLGAEIVDGPAGSRSCAMSITSIGRPRDFAWCTPSPLRAPHASSTEVASAILIADDAAGLGSASNGRGPLGVLTAVRDAHVLFQDDAAGKPRVS